jgi:hypothetical protein
VGDFAERKIIGTGARVRANGEFRLPQSKRRKTARRFFGMTAEKMTADNNIISLFSELFSEPG